MKKAIDIPNAPTPVGSYSQAILNNGTLYISGQIPMDPITKHVELLSIEKATHQVLKNIEALLLKIVDLIREFIPETKAVYLFGSFADGRNQPESDIDVAVHVRHGLTSHQKLLLQYELVKKY